MENAIKSLILVVPWMIMMSLRPVLAASHPWKDNPPDFNNWVERATPLLIRTGSLITLGFFMVSYYGTLVLLEKM